MMYLKWNNINVILIFIFIFNIKLVLSDTLLLRTNWTLENSNKSIIIDKQSIPTGVYSALENNGITKSVLDSYNDIHYRWISYDNWTYTINFLANKNVQTRKHVILTFHGLDTISTIYLNDQLIGETDNMFVRYRFDVKGILQDKNKLRLEFKSPVLYAQELAANHTFVPPNCPPPKYNGECHMNKLRKMQASFSWDWGLAAPSMGIWKPVAIDFYDAVFIRDVNYVLQDADPNTFKVLLKCYIETGLTSELVTGNMAVEIPELNQTFSFPVNNTSKNGELIEEVQLSVKKSEVELWWPNGYGKQKLYHIRVIWNTEINSTTSKPIPFTRSQKVIRIGFRTIELIEEDAEKGLSFYFKVNGANMFMKGSNWIPSHILPEYSADPNRIRHLLKSAKFVNVNMLRVWGGGLYEHDQFYDLADSFGILIWQDMMYACAMYPVYPKFLESVRVEIIQNLRRLQSHPSIAIWAANNENEVALRQNWYATNSEFDRFADEYRKLYVGVIKTECEEVDKSRQCLTSSPSNGKKAEDEGFISKDPQDWHYGDVHYYTYDLDGWDPNVFPKPRFVSEYGFQSYPALNSWKSILYKNDSLSEMITHRQHSPLGDTPITSVIDRHFGMPIQNETNYFEYLIYLSQLGQAMSLKTETEVYRCERGGLMGTMGALYWQLNDVWVAPSWSSIDFLGHFKIVHNWAKEFLGPFHIVGHVDKLNRLYLHVLRDSFGPTEKYKIQLLTYKWESLRVAENSTMDISIAGNTATNVNSIDMKDLFHGNFTKENSFIELRLKDENNRILSNNFVFPDKFKNCVGIKDPEIDIKIASMRCSFNVSHASLQVKVQYPAIFIYLQLDLPTSTKYVFSKNGFMQTTPMQSIQLEYDNINCAQNITIDDIKIMSVNQYILRK